MSKILSLFGFSFFVIFVPLQAQQTSVFVAAHPDDWQLFMNPNAFHAVSDSNQTVVFLHLTAGDAGSGMGNNNYTIAREEGSKRGIRFLVHAADPQFTSSDGMIESIEDIHNKNILSYRYGNTVSYFLRLPDGNFDGSGYQIHQEKSLRKLFSGDITAIHSVDSLNKYSRNQLISVIKSIARMYAPDDSISFHVAETDSLINPRDHSDHLSASRFIQEISVNLPGSRVHLYSEYYTRFLPMNVFPKDYEVSVGTWGATTSGIADFGHYSTWDEIHNSWLGRQYVRVLPQP